MNMIPCYKLIWAHKFWYVGTTCAGDCTCYGRDSIYPVSTNADHFKQISGDPQTLL